MGRKRIISDKLVDFKELIKIKKTQFGQHRQQQQQGQQRQLHN
jgi:hypothetical protein